MEYTELQVTTNFSFLRGGSHPEELVAYAAFHGYKEIAITDRNTLAGIVRAYAKAKKLKKEQGIDIRVIPGCRLDLQNGPSLLAYPINQTGYSELSGMLTEGNMRTEKGKCDLLRSDVFKRTEHMKFIVVPPDSLDKNFEFDINFRAAVEDYHDHIGANLYLGASCTYQGDDTKRLHRLWALSKKLHVPMVATNDVHYHHPTRRELQDVLTCIREKCTIYNAGFLLHSNSERFLKEEKEMKRLFENYPDAMRRTREITDACQFSLGDLKYVYPEEITNGCRDPLAELMELTWKGANKRYSKGIPEKVSSAIKYEMTFIKDMNYAPYFLTVYDLVRFAEEKQILCQGRGSAANSTVCYCLGITSVDPMEIDLLFERFISSARDEPPDIDVDFEHERREEVIQYIYQKYGRDRAGIVATVTQVHSKGAIRDVAKVMGMSLDAINKLSGSLWEFTDDWFDGKQMTEHGFNPKDPHLMKILDLTSQYKGFPRQLGQHTGGFVITQGKLSDLCPILNARMEDRTCIEWNKDDIDTLGFLKIDVLALGMLTCIRKAFDLAREHYHEDFTLANIPQNDVKTYDMICAADTIGVFQIESRAQQSMLPRLKPRIFYDLVIEVAIVRPGPIQGDMVHPYLRRRNGEEAEEYPSEELKSILEKTKGVPLFQEQAMKIAIVAGGFSPTEADELRRSMATFKAVGQVTRFEQKLIDGMIKKGYKEDFAKRIFRQLEGFGSYGFPESHAASFALLVYVSCYLKCHFPDVFAAALLNSMPMGFYQPAQIVIDARNHGVDVKPVDVNLSQWNNILEEKSGRYCAIRLGFRQIKGMNEAEAHALVAGRSRPYQTLNALLDAGISQATLERLADADAFRSMDLDRREAFWEASAMADRPVGIFEGQPSDSAFEEKPELPKMTHSEHVLQDYSTTSLSLKAHPVSFVRNDLYALKVIPTADLTKLYQHPDGGSGKYKIPDKQYVKVAGLILVRQRPGTAKGVLFMTIEDETGVANVVFFQKKFEEFRKVILRSKLIMIEGQLQREGIVTHVIANKCYDMSRLLKQLAVNQETDPEVLTLARADEKDEYESAAKGRKTRPEQDQPADIFFGGRNFR